MNRRFWSRAKYSMKRSLTSREHCEVESNQGDQPFDPDDAGEALA